MYDIFYMSEPDAEHMSGKVEVLATDGTAFWHCLAEDPALCPDGWQKFSSLPAVCKNARGGALHVFSGRLQTLEELDGGFLDVV